MANQFALEIVTPENIFYNDQVEMVIMRTTKGDRAILKDHIPFVAGLVEGQLRVKKMVNLKKEKFLEDLSLLQKKNYYINRSCIMGMVKFQKKLYSK